MIDLSQVSFSVKKGNSFKCTHKLVTCSFGEYNGTHKVYSWEWFDLEKAKQNAFLDMVSKMKNIFK